MIHAGAATEVPTIQNGGVNADATTWTFHLRPHLVWSDGQPYDARDVDFTWKLWANPKFGAVTTLGLNLISSTEVSADHLSITFHLKQPFAPFLADLWVDGLFAPLPAHYFSSMAPVLLIIQMNRRTSDDLQEDQHDRQTRTTTHSISPISPFLLLAACSRTDTGSSQHSAAHREPPAAASP